MATEYCRAALRIAIAQWCQNLGWQAVQSTPLEMLTDILERHIIQMGRITHNYSEQFGRTDPVLDDVGLAMQDMNVSLSELSEYVRSVEPIPCAAKTVDSFPKPRRNQLNIPELLGHHVPQNREEHIPDHLPIMTTEWEEVENLSKLNSSNVSGQGPDLSTNERSPMVEGQPPPKKSKMLPDEARHSNYEMKSVKMSNAGFLSPIRQGKLPDARTPPPSTPVCAAPAQTSHTTTPSTAGATASTIIPRNILGHVDSPKASKPASPLAIPIKSSMKSITKSSTTKVKAPIKGPKKLGRPFGKKKPGPKFTRKKSPRRSIDSLETLEPRKRPITSEDTAISNAKVDLVTCGTEPIKSSHDKSGKQKVASKLKERALKSSKQLKAAKKLGVAQNKSPLRPKRSPTKLCLADLAISEICQAGTAPILPPPKPSTASPMKSRRSPSKSPSKSIGKSSTEVKIKEEVLDSSTAHQHDSEEKYAEVSETIIPSTPATPYLPKPKFTSTPFVNESSGKMTRKKLKNLAKGKNRKKFGKKSPRPKSNLSVIPDESLEAIIDIKESPKSRHSRSRTRSMSRSSTKSRSLTPTKSTSLSPKHSPTRSLSRSPTGYKKSYSRSPVRSASRSPTRSRSHSPTRSRSWSPRKSRSRSSSPHMSPLKSISKSPVKSFSKSRSRSPGEISDSALLGSYLSSNPSDDRKPEIMFDDTDDETDRVPESLPLQRIDSWGTSNSPKQEMFSEDDHMDTSLQDIAKEVNVKFGSTSDDDFNLSSTSTPDTSMPLKKRYNKRGRGKFAKKDARRTSTRSSVATDVSVAESTLSMTSLSKNFDFPAVSYTGDQTIVKVEPEAEPSDYGLGSGLGLVKPLKITLGKPAITSIKTEDTGSIKDHKKDKKKKKNKDKDRERESSKERKERKNKHREKREKKREKSLPSSTVPKLTFKFGSSSTDVTVTNKANIPKLRIKNFDSVSSAHSTPIPTPTLPVSSHDSPLYSMSSSLASTSPASSPQQDLELSPVALSHSTVASSMLSDSHHTVSRETTPLRFDDTLTPATPKPSTGRRGRPPGSATVGGARSGPATARGSRSVNTAPTTARVPPIKLPTAGAGDSGMTVTTETVGTIVDESGQVIWICPACKMPDDGTPMVGCDNCDDWYHWICVGIKVEPAENDSWFCTRCKSQSKKDRKKKSGRTRKKK